MSHSTGFRVVIVRSRPVLRPSLDVLFYHKRSLDRSEKRESLDVFQSLEKPLNLAW